MSHFYIYMCFILAFLLGITMGWGIYIQRTFRRWLNEADAAREAAQDSALKDIRREKDRSEVLADALEAALAHHADDSTGGTLDEADGQLLKDARLVLVAHRTGHWTAVYASRRGLRLSSVPPHS